MKLDLSVLLLIIIIILCGLLMTFIVIVCEASEEPWKSEHFNVSEFRCKCCGEVKVSTNLVEKLEELREKVKTPIIITSGYRCPKHNKEAGGATYSQHMLGTAADIVAVGIDAYTLYMICQDMNFGFVKKYPSWVHVDVRQREGDRKINYLYDTKGSV